VERTFACSAAAHAPGREAVLHGEKMKTSSAAEVRHFYDQSAESYAALMEKEIDLPVYADILSRLADRIKSLEGPLIDSSCGSGHMLSRYHDRYDSARALVGIDLSPRMVAIAAKRLRSEATIHVGDMRDLTDSEAESSSAVLSFFAIHHLDTAGLLLALHDWRRVLRPGGQLVVAAWEGRGAVDYGHEWDVVALRYTEDDLKRNAQDAGFVVDRCFSEPVEGMPMDAVYLEATRP